MYKVVLEAIPHNLAIEPTVHLDCTNQLIPEMGSVLCCICLGLIICAIYYYFGGELFLGFLKSGTNTTYGEYFEQFMQLQESRLEHFANSNGYWLPRFVELLMFCDHFPIGLI